MTFGPPSSFGNVDIAWIGLPSLFPRIVRGDRCGLARGTVLLNCAGPYHQTAGILIDACIRNGIHYLDISAELDSYQISASRNEAAIRAGVMLLPGCGGSVAMLGFLAGLIIASVVDPVSIDIGMRVAGPMSRGSLASAGGNTSAALERYDGELREWEGDATTTLDFGVAMVRSYVSE